MLPWRVQVQRTLDALRADASFRNRVLGLAVALVLVVGAATTGLEVNIRFGRVGGDSSPSPSNLAAGDAGDGGSTESAVEDAVTDTTVAGEPLSGASAPPATGAAPAGGAAPKRAATATTTKPGTAGTAGNTGDPAAGGDPGAAGGAGVQAAGGDPTCEGANLTATDQGVSKDAVKIGVLIPNLNELEAAGFKVGLAGDYDKILPAWVKEMNERRGGVSCRKLTFVKEIFSVFDVDDMLAKCKAMTEDHKVFAVLTPGGYDSVAQLCIAKEHKTPFINPEPEPEGWYEDAKPYLWNLLMSKDRIHRNHVKWLVESGTIKPATRIGVVYHGIPNVAPPVEQTMLPLMNDLGVKPVSISKLSADDEQALTQISQTVLQFQRDQVQFVIMPMNLIFKTQFMQQAERQNYFPKYTDSDHYFGCFDFVTATYPEKSWEGSTCVSSLDINGMAPDAGRKFINDHPYAKYGDEVYKRAFPENYDENGTKEQADADTQRALFLGMGSQFLLFEQAADRVGPTLTRPAWGESMGQTGAFHQIPTIHPLTFGPRKWDGPDHLVVVGWHGAAGDGYPERRYRQKVPAFKAYF